MTHDDLLISRVDTLWNDVDKLLNEFSENNSL